MMTNTTFSFEMHVADGIDPDDVLSACIRGAEFIADELDSPTDPDDRDASACVADADAVSLAMRRGEHPPGLTLSADDVKTLMDALDLAHGAHLAALSTLGMVQGEAKPNRYEELSDRLTFGKHAVGGADAAPGEIVAPRSWSSPDPANTYSLSAIVITAAPDAMAYDYSNQPGKVAALRRSLKPTAY